MKRLVCVINSIPCSFLISTISKRLMIHLVIFPVIKQYSKWQMPSIIFLNNKRPFLFVTGGDAFYVYYQGLSEADVVTFAHYFHETLIAAESFTYEHMTLPLSVSMGSVYAAETHTPIQSGLKRQIVCYMR